MVAEAARFSDTSIDAGLAGSCSDARIDQREPAFGILDLAQMRRLLGHDHLERGTHMTFLQVTGQSRSVAPAENGVHVDARFPVRLRNVSDQRGNLDLLGDGDRLIRFRVPIEVGEPGLAKRADRRQLGGGYLFLLGEGLQAASWLRRPSAG